MIVHCALCNAELERTEGDVARNRSKLFFCNPEHRVAYSKKENWWGNPAQQRGYRRKPVGESA